MRCLQADFGWAWWLHREKRPRIYAQPRSPSKGSEELAESRDCYRRNLCLKCRMTKAAGDCCFQVTFSKRGYEQHSHCAAMTVDSSVRLTIQLSRCHRSSPASSSSLLHIQQQVCSLKWLVFWSYLFESSRACLYPSNCLRVFKCLPSGFSIFFREQFHCQV